MHFIRLCYDKPGMSATRIQHIDAHRAYLREHAITTLVSGPLATEASEDEHIGSFFLLEADTIAEVQSFHDDDPFTTAGIFGEVRIDRLLKRIG